METATTNYSPLDTLVRRVSSKRVNPANKLNVSTTRATQIQQAPPSPLLHSQFRSSVATDSDYGDKSYDNVSGCFFGSRIPLTISAVSSSVMAFNSD